ncbi:MAG: outer membrane beta-barrel protein [Desulfocapsa sp.]|nr:outer membrane beta-barrel protein [Desulfocapsa sp.]
MKTKFFTLASCLFFVSSSTFVSAQTGPYLGVGLGLSIIEDSAVTDSTMPGVTLDVSFDEGLDLGAAVGYGFANNIRLEGELSYDSHDIDQTSVFGMDFDSRGDAESLTLLLNGYYDFVNSSSFTPYLSGGLGFSTIEVNGYNFPGSGVPDLNEDDTVFAFQFGAGVGYTATDHIVIDLKYRYWATEDPNFGTKEAEVAKHLFILGLRYNF